MELVLENVRDLVKPQYDTLDCWVHSWPHVRRVTNNVKKVAEMEGINYVPCCIASYCHDLGRIGEEKIKQRGDISPPHALLSIEPTVRVLYLVGVKGVDFGEIVEAVTVHSYRLYEGGNDVAKVLQDGDKMNGFGAYGILGAVKYFGGVDYFDPKEIVANESNNKVLKQMCEESLSKVDDKTLEGALKGLGFVLEWFDMLHTKSAKELIREEYEYTKEIEKRFSGV